MDAQAMMVDGTMMLICGWFAKCGNPTMTALPLGDGYVPCCTRCAKRVSATDDLLTVELA